MVSVVRPGYRSPIRPGFQVIPDGWEAHHTPTAAGQATGRGRLVRRGDLVFDPATNTQTHTWEQVWPADAEDTPIRVQQLNRTRTDDVADQEITDHDYRVMFPRGCDAAEVGLYVEVTAASDGQLVGQRLRVTDVLLGTLRWQRDLICTDDVG
ncbi:hypothetical protein DT076_16615 [Desertihabitans brevis]|uniref:Uncharacterized protein n=1 Tax=Desertihabitans brevis TaxID=2268447 RepID=A0A367YTG5_9ACTN|nr:DUF6093 family protein [Desertihabitans brevis]RCK68271.1 hypothetical protein DT076_16615 [Desertihabitans brevis]